MAEVATTKKPRISPIQRVAGWGVVLVLLSAAILKIIWPAPNYPRAYSLGLSILEIIAAVWMMTGWRRSFLVPCLAGVFLVFAGNDAIELFQHRASCGCFGRIQIPPAWSLTIALSASLALISFPNFHWPPRIPGWTRTAVQILFLGILLATPLAIPRNLPTPETPIRGEFDDAKEFIASLKPADREKLNHGIWRIVVVDPTCGSCLRLLAELHQEQTDGRAPADENLMVAPTSSFDVLSDPVDLPKCDLAQLDSWPAICVPGEVVLHDGVITEATCE